MSLWVVFASFWAAVLTWEIVDAWHKRRCISRLENNNQPEAHMLSLLKIFKFKHKKGYGWKPQKPDSRDIKYVPCPKIMKALPTSVDLRSQFPVPYDQGQLGSCTGNGVAGVIHHRLIVEGKQAGLDINAPEQTPSRLFIYREERAIEGTVSTDSGAEVRDGLKSVATKGFCFEGPTPTGWPYTDSTTGATPPFVQNPPSAAWGVAYHHMVSKYSAVTQDINHLKAALAAGDPIVFGFVVYESFESSQVAQTGVVSMPTKAELAQGPIGGHCVVIVGYDDVKQVFLVRNSWGPNWGMKGYFTFPYAYVLDPNLSSDFWVVDVAP